MNNETREEYSNKEDSNKEYSNKEDSNKEDSNKEDSNIEEAKRGFDFSHTKAKILYDWKRLQAWVNGEEDIFKKKSQGFSPLDLYELRKTIKKKYFTMSSEYKRIVYGFLNICASIAFIAILLGVVFNLPSYGDSHNPASNEVVERYLEKGTKETGAVNIVAAIILDYRAFDTFGESAVLFLSVICVLMLLQRDKNNVTEKYDLEMTEDLQFDLERKDTVLKRMAALLIPLILLYGVCIILNGHLSPGGGFSGGSIIGAGLILYSTAFGHERVHKFLNYRRFTIICVSCMLTYCAAKGYSFFTGANHLESHIPKGVPGDILSAGFILPLNICVGLIVACTIYGFYALFTKGEI